MQPKISLAARYHQKTLMVENNQSRRRPTSWSLSKLPVSGLYWKLFAWGSTFLLDPSGTTSLIAGKPREKLELLSLRFLPPFLFSSFFLLPTILLGLKLSLESTFSTCQYPISSLDYPYHLIHLPWISLQSGIATCLLWVQLQLLV